MRPVTSNAQRIRPWVHLCLCALYVPVTVWATWPVARHVADHVIDEVRPGQPFGWLAQADILLHTWILSWGTHALQTRPGDLFDANIFHPARWSLLRSEYELGDLLFFAPSYLLTGNPVLAHQSAMLSTYVLSAATAYATVWRWLRRADAAFVAGALFAFAPYQLATLAHIQTLPTMYLPLVLLSGVEVLAGGGRPWQLALGGALVMQALCSAYLATLAFMAALATLGGWWLAVSSLDRRAAARYVGVLVLAAIVSAGLYAPYVVLARTGEIPSAPRSVQEHFSANPLAAYVPRPGAGDSVRFLSIPATLLALAGLVAPAGASRPARAHLRAVAAAVGLAGYVLSLGPTLQLGRDLRVALPFRLLASLPGLSALRAPARFGILVALAASVLAGHGVAALARARSRPWAGVLVTAVSLGLLAAEIDRFSFPLRSIETGDAVPPVYRWLAAHGGGEPVLELPVGADPADNRAIYNQSRYTYFSTYHWSPLLNGYSAYPPDSFFLLMAIARRLPEPRALQDLVDLSGLRWIVLHRDALTERRHEMWDTGQGEELKPAARFGEDILFRVTLTPASDRREKLSWPSAEAVTLSGVTVRPLAPEAMRGEMRDLDVPPVLRLGFTAEAWVTVRNRSDTPWPGLRAAPRGLVHVCYRWVDAVGHTISTMPHLSRIPTDLLPGESARVPFAVQPPNRPGQYRLRVTLVQKGGAWFDESGGPIAEAIVEVHG